MLTIPFDVSKLTTLNHQQAVAIATRRAFDDLYGGCTDYVDFLVPYAPATTLEEEMERADATDLESVALVTRSAISWLSQMRDLTVMDHPLRLVLADDDAPVSVAMFSKPDFVQELHLRAFEAGLTFLLGWTNEPRDTWLPVPELVGEYDEDLAKALVDYFQAIDQLEVQTNSSGDVEVRVTMPYVYPEDSERAELAKALLVTTRSA